MKIGLWTDDRPSGRYCEEILSHAGLPWERLAGEAPLAAAVILLAGRPALSQADRERLTAHVLGGGALVTTGGLHGLEALFGAREAGPVDEGYLTAESGHPLTAGLTSSLHLFGGVALRAGEGHPVSSFRDGGLHGVVLHRPGRGVTVAIGPDLPGSVLAIQLGRPVREDGLPAPDGTAPIDDGVLKTDDGVLLSWERDRERLPLAEPVPDCPGKHPAYPDGDTPWFAQPVADELRELLVKALLWAAQEAGHPLPMLWYWPHGLQAVGLVSHDSDLNIDASAQTTLDLLKEAGVNSTWCTQYGPFWPDRFTAQTHARVLAEGHEVALHYNALSEDGGAWGQEHLREQIAWVKRETGVSRIISNKNHYLRWEGSVEFFRWLEAEGVEADQSKGPSKRGNVGFPHGSCQPWFPYDAEQGRFLDVLELPTLTQDLWLTAPLPLAVPLVEQAVKHHGVAHFLFHQAHLHRRSEVADAFRRVVREGRDRGLQWWTCAQINAWERLRRQVTITLEGGQAGEMRLRVSAPAAVEGAGLVLLLPADMAGSALAALSDGQPVAVRPWSVYGLQAVHLQLNLLPGETTIEVRVA